jgi:hypothetical protein
VKAGIEPCRRGRPKKGHMLTENEKDNEIKRLKMEINFCGIFFAFPEGSECNN